LTVLSFRPFLLAVAAGCTFGCADEDAAAEPEHFSEVALDFELVVNGAPFRCGDEYEELGEPPLPFTVTDARFYLHDLALLHETRGWLPLELERGTFQAQNLALLDFENGCGPDGTEEMHTTLTGSVASQDRDFVGLRFTLGVPPEQNFIDLSRAAPPLDVTGMFWTWQVGYKYVKLDGSSPASGGGINPFFLHLGASACPGDNPQAPPSAACAQPNLASFELLEFSPTAQRVVADLASLLASSDLSFNTEGTGPGCMSEPNDPECLTLLPRLGIDDGKQQKFFATE
jgi:uncharacterized repeat protein (TIGR04052 family)